MIAINPDDPSAYIYHGAIDGHAFDSTVVTAHSLRAALEAVARGATPPRAQTRAVGYGIDFRPANERPGQAPR